MTINSRPERDDQQDRSAFLDRATQQDTAKLQCWIPSELHHWFKGQSSRRAHQHDCACHRGPGELPARTRKLNNPSHNSAGEHQREALPLQSGDFHFHRHHPAKTTCFTRHGPLRALSSISAASSIILSTWSP